MNPFVYCSLQATGVSVFGSL